MENQLTESKLVPKSGRDVGEFHENYPSVLKPLFPCPNPKNLLDLRQNLTRGENHVSPAICHRLRPLCSHPDPNLAQTPHPNLAQNLTCSGSRPRLCSPLFPHARGRPKPQLHTLTQGGSHALHFPLIRFPSCCPLFSDHFVAMAELASWHLVKSLPATGADCPDSCTRLPNPLCPIFRLQ